jgi:hypothetical protein
MIAHVPESVKIAIAREVFVSPSVSISDLFESSSLASAAAQKSNEI